MPVACTNGRNPKRHEQESRNRSIKALRLAEEQQQKPNHIKVKPLHMPPTLWQGTDAAEGTHLQNDQELPVEQNMPVWTSCVWKIAACPKWVSEVGVSSNLSRNCCHCSKMRRCWWKLLTASAASISCWFATSFSDAWCAGGSQTWLDGICSRSVFCFCRTRNSDGKCKWLVGLAQISTKLKIHPYRAWLGQHLVIWWPSLLVASHGQPRGSPKVGLIGQNSRPSEMRNASTRWLVFYDVSVNLPLVYMFHPC